MADSISIEHTTLGLMGRSSTRLPARCLATASFFSWARGSCFWIPGLATREMLELNRVLGDDALFKLGHVIDLRLTALERLRSRGIRPEQVTDIILTFG